MVRVREDQEGRAMARGIGDGQTRSLVVDGPEKETAW